jgi:hypothetical protein
MPVSYQAMLDEKIMAGRPISIQIVDTPEQAEQSSLIVGGGLVVGQNWKYNQLEILTRLASETEKHLNDLSNTKLPEDTLRVSGEVSADFAGDYTAKLTAYLTNDKGVQVGTYEAQGFVESKVASEIAVENAYKLAFGKLAEQLVAPNQSNKAPASQAGTH